MLDLRFLLLGLEGKVVSSLGGRSERVSWSDSSSQLMRTSELSTSLLAGLGSTEELTVLSAVIGCVSDIEGKLEDSLAP